MPLTIDATDEEWITLDEVRAQANIGTGHDEELYIMRGAAQDAVEGLVGPVLWRDVTETVPVTGGVAVLRYNPVVSVSAVTTSDLAAQTYTLNADAGLLTGITTTADVTVTYVAGRASVPDALRQAALIIAAHLWQTQLGSTPTPMQEGFGTEPTVGMGYGIPNRAADLLAPYLLGPGIA